MINRTRALFSRELSGLHEAAFLLAISSMASAVLALFRDRLFAHIFGAGRDLDIYYAAFRIPDFLFVSIASFVSVTVLIPFVVERLGVGDHARAVRFFNELLTVFFVVMIVVCIIVGAVMPTIAPLAAPGFDSSARGAYILLSRILLLSPFLLGLSNLLGSVTQSLRKFFVYALSPIVYNLGIIFGALVFYPIFGLPGLAWGVALGAFFHMAVQIPTIVRAGFIPHIVRRVRLADLTPVIRLSLPRTAGLGLNQVVVMVLVALGSYMTAGSISIFNFAYNLQSVPMSIIGISYSVAAFPTLAKFISTGKRELYVQEVVNSIRYILFWSLPATAIVIALRREIVSAFLGSGRFTNADTQLTAATLAVFVFSVAAQGLLLLFTRSYYAAGQTKKPLFANMFSAIFTMALAASMVHLFSVAPPVRGFFETLLDIPSSGKNSVLMLPLAFSIGTIVNVYIHWIAFIDDFRPKRELLTRPLGESITAAMVTALIITIVRDTTTLSGVGAISRLIIGVVVGSSACLAFLSYMRNEELAEVIGHFRSRFVGTRAIAHEPQEL